ncbi:zinc finger protein 518A [Trichomycterus rosablanca]|uniref:zinc finger protein 518A n=1 Tax=Trichomycterus rosablanca TaxID=2290929 RepID=UPI002F3552F3
MEVMADDPPQSHDQNGNAKKHVLTVHTLSLKELANQTEITYNDIYNHDDALFGESESGTESHTESKSLEKSPCKVQQGAVFSGKILSFCCSECKGDVTYSPNDLLKHFQGVHKGTLPTYPCDLCTFVTNEFSSLQRHRIGHRDTFVTCEICNDGVQYTLLLLTRHFIMCHSCNGLFRCKKCDFSTRDAGTFVQHIHHHNEDSQKHVKCPSMSPTQGKVYSGKAHSGTFPFTCQFCGFGASWKEYLNKHMSVAHADEVDKTNRWRTIDDGSKVNSPGLKLLLKKSPPPGGSREPQWISQLNSLPGVGLLDHNGRLLNPEKTLEETQQFLERAVGVKKESNKWSKGILKGEQQSSYPVTSTTAQPKMQENELTLGSGILDSSNSNGLTVLMVKNKISIPPNCTTKVMGFKMVDGKKHLVLKVIPTKQEPDTKIEENEKTTSSPSASMSCRSGCVLGSEFEKKKDLSDLIKVEAHDSENNNSDGSQLVDEHKAKQVCEKVHEPSASHCVDLVSCMNKEAPFSKNQTNDLEKKPSPVHELSFSHSIADQSSNSTAEDLSVEEVSQLESTVHGPTIVSNLITVSASEAPMCSLTSDCIENDVTAATVDPCEINREQTSPRISINLTIEKQQRLGLNESESLPSENAATVNTCPVDGKSLQTNSANDLTLSTDLSPRKELTERKQASDNTSMDSQNANITSNGETFQDTTPQNKPNAADLFTGKDGSTEVEAVLQNSPNQEVFSFHNYSKETFGSPPDLLDVDQSPGDIEGDEYEENFEELKLDADWSLTLPASPPIGAEQSEECLESGSASDNDQASLSLQTSFERVSDSDIEVDECIATVDEFPIEQTEKRDGFSEPERKAENAGSSALEKGTANLSNAAVLGKILEKHSDAIISQQLEKDRMVSTATPQDTNRPTKTTLRIVQMPEGKRQMFLQTAETPYAVPVQLTSGPGFKLITKSCASQVNVSYMKSGIERSCKGTGLSLTLNGGRIGMSAQGLGEKAKGQASVLQTANNSGGHYIVSASALKRPLLLSSPVKSSSGEQRINTQQTCYLVHQPLPVAPVSSESTDSTPKTVLATRSVLTLPVNSADKAAPLQTGRQAYLVRYISQAKSGLLVNNTSEKNAGQGSQANTAGKNRFLVVRGPNGTRFLTTAPYTSAKKPIYVAAKSLQSPYILMSSDNSITKCSAGLNTSNASHSPSYKLISAKLKDVLSKTDINNKQAEESSEFQSTLMPINACSQSLRRRKRSLLEGSFETHYKTRRVSSMSSAQKEPVSPWKPVAKDAKRTLRLTPFRPFQQIKCPRQNQPVVVLNHPDADIPEVANIMKSIKRYNGEVVKVALSQSTVSALSKWSLTGPDGRLSKNASCVTEVLPRTGNNVKERFILKLKFKKKNRRKYEVVKLSSNTGSDRSSMFRCWFCGRAFNNQEEWIGHGQRHLMEATRDWNKVF